MENTIYMKDVANQILENNQKTTLVAPENVERDNYNSILGNMKNFKTKNDDNIRSL